MSYEFLTKEQLIMLVENLNQENKQLRKTLNYVFGELKTIKSVAGCSDINTDKPKSIFDIFWKQFSR